MENEIIKIKKMEINPNKIKTPTNNQLVDIALDVFGRNKTYFESIKQESEISNFEFYGLLGKLKAVINPTGREVVYYNKKHSEKIETILDRYNDLTIQGHWVSIPPKSKCQ